MRKYYFPINQGYESRLGDKLQLQFEYQYDDSLSFHFFIDEDDQVEKNESYHFHNVVAERENDYFVITEKNIKVKDTEGIALGSYCFEEKIEEESWK